MADAVKEALQPLGYDVQICYSCGGPARSVRLVADGSNATAPQNPAPGALPTPEGKLDFGATGAELLQYAYLGIHDFARDKEGPRKQLRLLAKLQTPTYYMVAVDAQSGITDLRQIAEKKLPVKLVARGGLNEGINVAFLDYFGLSADKIKSFGGTTSGSYTRGSDVDVVIGWAALLNAPEYAVWYDAPQQHDFKYPRDTGGSPREAREGVLLTGTRRTGGAPPGGRATYQHDRSERHRGVRPRRHA